MKNVLVIGSEGYIGLALCQHLQNKYNLKKVDLCWFGRYQYDVKKEDFSNLTSDNLKDIDAIVLLAGHSSVKMCVGDWNSTFNNNILNFVSLANKIKQTNKNIKLIFASSSSVYGNTFGEIADESYLQKPALNEYDASKIILEHIAIQEKDIEWYGLRFGTVNGYSNNFRSELMINSMYTSYKRTSIINVTNPTIHRAIIGINDLCRSIETIIEKGSFDKKGFYNISSFNSTVDNIAKTISNITGAEIKYNPDIPMPYDFRISNDKFESTFDFKFNETLESIVNKIEYNFYKISNIGNRNSNIKY